MGVGAAVVSGCVWLGVWAGAGEAAVSEGAEASGSAAGELQPAGASDSRTASANGKRRVFFIQSPSFFSGG